MADDTNVKLDLILRQQKTIIEELRMLKATTATKADIADMGGRISGLYDAYADMARAGALALERIGGFDKRVGQVEAQP
jgi:hypothetical protein